jgi:hypothetical protein
MVPSEIDSRNAAPAAQHIEAVKNLTDSGSVMALTRG